MTTTLHRRCNSDPLTAGASSDLAKRFNALTCQENHGVVQVISYLQQFRGKQMTLRGIDDIKSVCFKLLQESAATSLKDRATVIQGTSTFMHMINNNLTHMTTLLNRSCPVYFPPGLPTTARNLAFHLKMIELLPSEMQGRGGSVWIATFDNNSHLVKKGLSEHYQALHEKEVALFYGIPPHPGIVSFCGLDPKEGEDVVWMEYAPDGDLYTWLQRTEATTAPLCVSTVYSVAIQLSNALAHLHRNRILYLDMKPENALLWKDQDLRVKLTDFGSSIDLRSLEGYQDLEDSLQLVHTGSPRYMPPECFLTPPVNNELPLSFKTDIWSLGCTFLELLYPRQGDLINELCPQLLADGQQGRLSLKELNSHKVLSKYLRTIFAQPNIQGKIDAIVDITIAQHRNSDRRLQAFGNLVKQCLVLEPSERPTVEAICLALSSAQAA